MKIIYYPDKTDKEGDGGPILRFFKNLIKERPPQLWLLVRELLEKVERASSLNDLEGNGWIKPMNHLKSPIYEFRIPPTRRRQGVVRLYFAYKKNDPKTIVILSAEKKQGKIKADSTKTKQAEQRYREVCL